MPLSSEEIRQAIDNAEQDILEGFKGMLEPVTTGPVFEVTLLGTGLEGAQVVTVADQLVTVPWVYHARHIGPFLGVPATYQHVDLAGASFINQAGDPSAWTYTRFIDFLGALNQMGVSVVTRPALTPDEFKVYRQHPHP